MWPGLDDSVRPDVHQKLHSDKRNYVVVHLCQQGRSRSSWRLLSWHHFRLCHYLLAYLLKYIVILSYDVLHINTNVTYIYRYRTIHPFRQHSQCTPIYHQCDLCDLELWYFVSKIIVTAECLKSIKCTEVGEIASVFLAKAAVQAIPLMNRLCTQLFVVVFLQYATSVCSLI